MISVPDSFWKEECRDDFYISEVMKKSWAVQLTLLDEILEIADKHNIKIWLDYGSLLGAVRHHGYIPWDDDIDTAVMRKDYLPLINYLKEELPPYRVVSSFYTNVFCNNPTTVVSSRKNMDIGNSAEETEITKHNFGFPYSSWVDIFPMDYVPDNPDMWHMIRNLYTAAFEMAIDMEALQAKGEFEDDLEDLEKLTHCKIKRDENIRNSLWKLADKIASSTTRKESHKIGWYGGALHVGGTHMRPASTVSKIINAAFEFTTLPIPAEYDKILKIEYGDSYMTPRRVYDGHDYPHFKNQERAMIACSRMGQLGDIFS